MRSDKAAAERIRLLVGRDLERRSIGTLIGTEIGKALFGDPEADARRGRKRQYVPKRNAAPLRKWTEKRRSRRTGSSAA